MDRDGADGDGALMVATSAHGDLLLLRVTPEAVPTRLTTLANVAPAFAQPLSNGGDRILVPIEGGGLWLDRAGEVVSRFRFAGADAGASAVRATPDGGLWRIAQWDAATLVVTRYYGDDRPPERRDVRLRAGDPALISGLDRFDFATRPDGGLLLTGGVVIPDRVNDRCANPRDCADGVILSLDATGAADWAVAYGAAALENFRIDGLGARVVATADNGGLLSGLSNSFAYPRSSSFSVRVDANGAVSDNCIARAQVPLAVEVSPARQPLPLRSVGGLGVASNGQRVPNEFIEIAPRDIKRDVVTARSCSGESGAPTLRVRIVGEGSVESFPYGIDCPGKCTQTFATGAEMELTAVGAGGSRLTGWSGNCSGSAATTRVTLAGARTCTATFGAPCAADGQCARGERCMGGACVAPEPECRRDADCDQGHRCADGVCVVRPGACIPACAAGQVCMEGICRAPSPRCDAEGFGAGSQTFDGNALESTYEAAPVTGRDAARLTVQFRNQTLAGVGRYPLGATEADRDPETCTTCAFIRTDCDESGCGATYFASTGTVDVTALDLVDDGIEGTLTGAVFERVDGEGFVWCVERHVIAVSACAPRCDRDSCGDDGCGGTCVCQGLVPCNPATRRCEPCAPTCEGTCEVADGCGGVCACRPDQTCDPAAQRCLNCEPACAPGACGVDDGCGEPCACDAADEVCDLAAEACVAPPAAPLELVAAAGTGSVELTWGDATGASSHTVYYGGGPGVTPQNGVPIVGATSPHVVEGLAPDVPVWFIVTGTNLAGEGPPSNEVTATPRQADLVGPTVVFTEPRDDARDVDPDTVIRVGFSEPLDPASLADGVLVTRDGVEVPGVAEVSDVIVVFTPDEPLDSNAEYVVALTTALRDPAGNTLAVASAFAFETGLRCRDRPTFEAVEATCDGLDNDCDGAVDEPCDPCLADRDHDGVEDCIEAALGTDPLDPASVIRPFVAATTAPRVLRLSEDVQRFSVAVPVSVTYEEEP